MKSSEKGITRRTFLEGVAVASAFTVIPRSVLGGPGFVAPSDRINIAQIGAGTQALRQFNAGIMTRDDVQVTSVTDPNRDSQDYLDWSRFGVRRSIRRLLEDESWGENDTGTRGGRDVAKNIIETYYGKVKRSGDYKGVAAYEDVREMLAAENDVDAVMIIVPDHLHAHLSTAAMKAGKAVVMHKPVALTPHELRRVLEVEKETGAVTHLLAYGSAIPENHRRLQSWLRGGIVGQIREVHNWTNRPVWPQGWTDYPTEEVAIPGGFNWELWQGPIPYQAYHPLLTHTLYRGWYNYGAGCLGDMGNYSLWQPHRFLDLDAPEMVEAYTNRSVVVNEHGICQSTSSSPVAYPHASQIHFRYPAKGDRPEVDVFWYSGSMKPQTPEELIDERKQLANEGMLFVGDYGKILCEFRGENPRLIPESRMQAMGIGDEEEQDLDQNDEWTEAIRTKGHSRGSFSEAANLAETTVVGMIALRNPGQRLYWDSDNMRFTNNEDANKLVRRDYREGWEL